MRLDSERRMAQGGNMKSLNIVIACAALAVAGQAVAADSRVIVKPDAAEVFIKLPSDVSFPEGITAAPNGDIYVATFDFDGSNQVLRYSKRGTLLARREFGDSPLLGLAYNASDGKVYIANVRNFTGETSNARIQRIAADFGPATAIEDVATIPPVGVINSAPNAFEFDADGNLLVSDSFNGRILRVDITPPTCAAVPPATPTCVVTTVVTDDFLTTAGFPGFGANGLARKGNSLFVANTGNDTILKIDLTTKAVDLFANSVNGADGIAFDSKGRLWVAANQGDHLVALNGETGRVEAQLGAFLGIKNGMPRGLLFPASIVIVGKNIFVTNLAFAAPGGTPDDVELDVTRWTISRIEIPHGDGGHDDD
jgi:DNA-binding beta-propeller fold protein YncE